MFVTNKRKNIQMRRIYLLFIAGTFLFGMASCNDNKGKEADVTTENVTTTENTETSTSSNTDTQVALNPPHGEPGHICEIPVGQPLPNGNAAAASNTSSSNEAVRLNPAHGQPGHVCEIPVGQPLPNASGTNTAVPNNVQLKTPLMKENQKLNPPHGQPGHVCEIPVGQPLP